MSRPVHARSPVAESRILRYGNLITLYDATVSGHVVPSFTSDAPVGVQRDTGNVTIPYEAAVFEVQPAFAGATGSQLIADGSTTPGTQTHLGDVVKFGHSVRLVHHMRQQCLSHHMDQHAIGTKSNLRVLLDDATDDSRVAVRWRLLPRYRMRAEGEAVVDGDAVVLMSVDDRHMLNRADRFTGETSHNHQFLEVSCGPARQPFSINIYDSTTTTTGSGPGAASTSDANAEALHFGDVLSLRHTESGMLLYANAESRQCFLRSQDAPTAETPRDRHVAMENLTDPALGEDLRASAAHQLYAATSEALTVPLLFVIEALDPQRGGLVPTGEACRCRLKSLATGLYLQTGVDTLDDDRASDNGDEATQRDAQGTPHTARSAITSMPSTARPSLSVCDEDTSVQQQWEAPFAATAQAAEPVRVAPRIGRDSVLQLDELLPTLTTTASAAHGRTLQDFGVLPSQARQRFATGLSEHREAAGTVFRLHSLDAHDAPYAQAHHRVLLEAVQTRRGPLASLWLTAGTPKANVEDVTYEEDEEDGTSGAEEGMATDLSSAGPLHTADTPFTIGDLTETKALAAAALHFTSHASTSDVLEVNRLPARAVRDVVTVRALLQPLFDYREEMARGVVPDSFRVREVRTNVAILRGMLRLALPSPGNAHSTQTTGHTDAEANRAKAGLRSHHHLESLLDPHWQTKQFHFGVVDAALDLVRATLQCPSLPTRLLYAEDIIDRQTLPGSATMCAPPTPAKEGVAAAEEEVVGADTDHGTTKSEPPLPAKAERARHRGPPQRYSEFGKAIDVCLQCVSDVLRDRPELAASRQREADWLLQYCDAVQSIVPCVATFYECNPVFVELPYARRRLDFFLRHLTKHGPDADVLTILRLFAQCGDESMVDAQEVIVEYFLRTPDMMAKSLCQLRLLAPSELVGATAETQRTEPVESVLSEVDSLAVSTRAERSMQTFTTAATAATTQRCDVTSTTVPRLSPPSRKEPLTVDALARPYGGEAESDDGSTCAASERVAVVALHNQQVTTTGSDGGSLLGRAAAASISTGTRFPHAPSLFGEILRTAATALDRDGITYFPLAGLREVRAEWPEMAEQFLPLFVAQLRLLAALAAGRHERARKVLVEQCVPTALLLPAAANELNLPSAVHAAFVELFTCVCVDRAGAFELSVDLNRISCAVTSHDDADAPVWRTVMYECASVAQEMLSAKRYALLYLSTHTVQREASRAKVDVFISVIDMLAALVRSGGFALHEYEELVAVLSNTLEASCESEGVVSTQETRAQYRTRMSVLDLFHKLVDVLVAVRALSCVTALHRGQGGPQLAQLLSFHVESDDTPFCSDARTTSKDCASSQTVAHALDVLLRLTAATASPDVRQTAIALFYRLTNANCDIANTARRVQLLTSRTSVDLYHELGHVASALEAIMHKTFARANTLAHAHQLVDRLEDFHTRSTKDSAAFAITTDNSSVSAQEAEWLSMVHHVGLETVLVTMLLGLPVPLKGSARRLSTRVLRLLQSWTRSEVIRSVLCRSAERLAPLASHDRTVLALLHSLYLSPAVWPTAHAALAEEARGRPVDDDEDVVVNPLLVPALVIDQVVRCMRYAPMFTEALHFLSDLLLRAASLCGDRTRVQKAVWQALVSDQFASAMIDFSSTWCDLDNGARYREGMLTTPAEATTSLTPTTSPLVSNPLATHIALCQLIYRIAIHNDAVHPEQIRHEVFGRSSLDMILGVLTDGLLPAYFRLPYLRFMLVLVLEDSAAGPEVLTHPCFTSFLRTCMLDIYLYLHLCGGPLPFVDLEEELERRESLLMTPMPTASFLVPNGDDAEEEVAAMAGEDSACQTYRILVLGPLCASLKRITSLYGVAMTEMGTRVQAQVKVALNETLDALADLAWYVCGEAANVSREDVDQRGTEPPMERRKVWRPAECRSVLEVLETAAEHHFQGTSRWRHEPWLTLTALLSQAASLPASAGIGTSPARVAEEGRAIRDPVVAAMPADPSLVWSPRDVVMEGVSLPDVTTLDAPKGLPRTTQSSPARHTLDTGSTLPLTPSTVPVRPYAQTDSDRRSSAQSAMNPSDWSARLEAWVATMHNLSTDSTFVTAAGVVLRSGSLGGQFLSALFCALPGLRSDLIVSTLHLVRHIVTLRPGHAMDEAATLPIGSASTYEGALGHVMASAAVMAGDEHVNDDRVLSLAMLPRQRQGVLSQWPGDANLDTPMPLLALVTELIGSSCVPLRKAALWTATTLLAGGHRGMQQSYLEYSARSAHEMLFYILRNRLNTVIGELRRYVNALSHGSTPHGAAYLLPTLDEATHSLLLLQLLCMGQYTPLQSMVAAQPQNVVSVNLFEPMLEMLSLILPACNVVTAPLFIQLLATVSETMLGPCTVNQHQLASQGLSDVLTHIIHAPFRLEASTAMAKSASGDASDTSPLATQESRQQPSSTAFVPIEKIANAFVVVLPADMWQALHGGALSALLSLIEGRREPSFMRNVVASMDLTALVARMDESAALYQRRHGRISRQRSRGTTRGDVSGSFAALKQLFRDYYHSDFPTDAEELRDELTVAVKIFQFLRACYDVQNLQILSNTRRGEGKARLFFDALTNEFKDKQGRTLAQVARKSRSFAELATKVGGVEIVRDGRLERVYFRILASSQENLYRRTRTKLIDDAVRSSDNERIQFFFRRTVEVMLELDVYRSLRRKLPLYVIHCCSQEVNTLSLFVILAINLTLLFSVVASTSPYRTEDTAHAASLALHVLGIVNIVTEAIMLIQTFIGPAWANLLMGWERWRNEQAAASSVQALRRLCEAPPQQTSSVEVTWQAPETQLDEAAVSAPGSSKARLSLPEQAVRSVVYLLSTGTFFQHLIFLFFCIMGFVQSPTWYAAQLFQVLLNSTILQFMFRSLSVRVIPLFLTLCTLFFAVYFFSTITYYNFPQVIDPLTSGNGNGFNCYTMKNCWMVHLDTLRKGGGIGDVAQWPTFYSHDNYAYGFFAFRFIYYVCVSLVINNLFLGVIIDGLAESRARRATIEQDQTKKCFICGQERNLFDVWQPGAYDTHISEEHNMWQYVYFLHYLSKKDPSTFTGQEAHVYHLVQLRDVTFFPIGQSLMLSVVNQGQGTSSSQEGSTATAQSTTAVSPPLSHNAHVGCGGGGGPLDAATRTALQEVVSASVADELEGLKRILEVALGIGPSHSSTARQSMTSIH